MSNVSSKNSGKWFKDDDHNHQILWKTYQKWLHESITKIIDKTEEEKFFVLLISMNNNDSRGGVHFQIAADSTQVFPYEKHFNIMHIINNVLDINVFLWQITFIWVELYESFNKLSWHYNTYVSTWLWILRRAWSLYPKLVSLLYKNDYILTIWMALSDEDHIKL